MGKLIKIEAPVKPATNEEINARITLLCGEIDANEEENLMMQEEITNLYRELDKRKEEENAKQEQD